MTIDDGKEWGCGTCTFLNQPLFLSCEMCGQARPSQRPSPPRRQPSLPMDNDRRSDQAPRSVQRHHSAVEMEGGIQGTLVMTDDPDDYETQDGKKPGEGDDECSELELEINTGLLSYERRRREDDPTMDESMERHLLEAPRHERHDRARRHTLQASSFRERPREFETHHNQISPLVRKPSPTANGQEESVQTLPTVGGSSSSQLHLDDSFAEETNSFSNGNISRNFSGHSQGLTGNNSRRLRAGRRSAAPQEIHYHGRSNGLPVISRDPPSRYQNRSFGNSSSSGLMDSSGNSHYSYSSHDSSGRHSMSRSAISMRNLGSAQDARGHMRRGMSVAHLPNNSSGTGNGESFLPSLAPPPVPTMDSPGDVDAMAIFAKDQQASERNNRRKSAHEARKDRGKMLENITRSNRELMGNGSSTSSSRRRQSASQRGFSTRLLGERAVVLEDDAEQEDEHPALMCMDDGALDSPNTRRERRKEKRRMKGAVRTLMATMRIASVTK